MEIDVNVLLTFAQIRRFYAVGLVKSVLRDYTKKDCSQRYKEVCNEKGYQSKKLLLGSYYCRNDFYTLFSHRAGTLWDQRG